MSAQLSQAQRAQLESLRSESDEGLFWEELLNFGKGLEATEHLHAAGEIYTTIANAPLTQQSDPNKKSIQEMAEVQLHAIQGKGSFGGRTEFLLRHFSREATDPRVILPMMAGSVVYGAVRAAALSRLATATRGAWYTHGLAARLAATSLGFAAEVPTFALSARALRQAEGPTEGPSLGQELGSAALTLGFLKSFAFAGNQAFRNLHGISAHGVPQRLTFGTRISQFAFTQGSMFSGLLAAHRAEEAMGWRPHVDGATTVTDTLASMLSLSVGARLGHKVLGPRLATFLAETQGRAEWAGRLTDLAPGLRPILATAHTAPGGMLLAMSIGEGRGTAPPGENPGRILRELRVEISDKDAKPKARRRALETLIEHIKVQPQGDPCIPEGAKALRELFEDKDDAIAMAAMEHYGTLFLVGYNFGPAETPQGQRSLERIRDNVRIPATRRKKAELALTYLEGGMELNDYAKFYTLEGTQPLAEPRAPRAINIEHLFRLVLPTQLRKIFLAPNTSETATLLARDRYITLMRSRPVDLIFEAELLELKKRFGAVTGKPIYLETPEARSAALAYIELLQKYSWTDLGSREAISNLRRIFTYDGHTKNSQIQVKSTGHYQRMLNLLDFEKGHDWWQGELAALHEVVRNIHLKTVNPPSPWVEKASSSSEARKNMLMDSQSQYMILLVYVQLLRPLPTTHPTFVAGMQMLERLSRRRAGVEPRKADSARKFLLQLREQKPRVPPETIHVKGWGADPQSGKPFYIDRKIDPKDYEIREIQTSQGPQVLIEGSDLRIQLPGTRQTLGLSVIPFLAALGLGLETLLAPNTAMASPLVPLVSGDFSLLLVGATAAVSAALGFWAGWRTRGKNDLAPLLEINNPEGSIYRTTETPQGCFNFLAALNPKRFHVTAFHENGQPHEILFTKKQKIRGYHFSAGFKARLDAEGKVLSMVAGTDPKWYDAGIDSPCRINDCSISKNAEIFFTNSGEISHVQFPSGEWATWQIGAYYAESGSRAYFHESGELKAFVSSGYYNDPLKERYKGKYVFLDRSGRVLGAGEQLSDYHQYVNAPKSLRIADHTQKERVRPPKDEAAEREAEAMEEERLTGKDKNRRL